MSPPPQVTDEQVAAAKLRIILDGKLGRETPEFVRRIAAAAGIDSTEPASGPVFEPIPQPTTTEHAVTPPQPTTAAPALPTNPSPLVTALGVDLGTELLTLALTHRSYAYEHGGLPPNERLEFLGDAVLGWVVTDHLYREHPDLPEGNLAKLRAGVVNMQALAGVARELGPGGLGAHLLLGVGEEQTGGRDKASILADGLEAVIGAVYLEHGTETVRQLVHRLFGRLLTEVRRRGAGLDWKTSLQELTSGAGLGVPEYLLREAGPDHHREFTATVVVGGEERGSGAGRTKKEAEQHAAELAWRAIAKMIDSEINPGF